jgi:hypothetical protein
VAAGAILAGAAIPIAAAATAWADETETTGQLEHQGLTRAEAHLVVSAENNGTPVQVSYDGSTVVNDNQGAAPSAEASAASGSGPHDVAAAIGGGSIADASAGYTGDHDTSIATGGAYASSGDGNHDTATANGYDSTASAGVGNYDTATVTGNGSEATTGGDSNTSALGNHDTATVTGNDSTASAGTLEGPGSEDKAIVKGDDSVAYAGYGFIHDKAEALGSNLTADAYDHNGQTVIVRPEDMTPLVDLHSMPMLP